MWKSIRTILALFCLLGFVVLFCDQSENRELARDLAWLAQIQLVPALMAGSMLVVLALVALTLVFGRVYCSVVCPLGLLQDVLATLRGSKRAYCYRPGKPVLRGIMLTVFIVSIATGIPVVFGLLEPYSAFARIATDIGGPLATLIHNGAEWLSRRFGSEALMPQGIFGNGMAACVLAVVTLAVLAVLSIRGGRMWCNTMCPVGTFLGLFSRYAHVRPRMSAERCTHCGQCASRCKAGCIDAAHATVDASRCVACFNCKDVCKFGALYFERDDAPVTARRGRRAALSGLLAGTASVLATPALLRASGGDTKAERDIPATHYKAQRRHATPILPPGAQGIRHFAARCTGCQLCVSACPNHVLRSHDRGMCLLQPAMHFEHGFCRTNCTACGEVCPAGAILPVSHEEKTAIQVGRARINPDACVVTTDKVPCTACQRACPAGVISLVGEGDLKRPAVDAERCTGCGACEFHCPVRPVAAIQVEGNLEHRQI